MESLGELKFAAEQSGTSLETVEKAAKKMAKNVTDAGAGLKGGEGRQARRSEH